MTEKISFQELYPLIRESIDRGDSFSFTAFGSSMLPYIKGGFDRVFLSPQKRPLQKYDIVFYKRENGMFVLHRIVGIKKEGLTLCGDNQYALEKGVKKEQVIAILDYVERDGSMRSPRLLSHRIWCRFLFLRRFYLHVKSYISRKLF